MKEASIKPGRYRHYKGNCYEVIGVARHSETEVELVVYRCLYGDHSLWVRPLAMFVETVTVAGRKVPRFELIVEKCQGTRHGLKSATGTAGTPSSPSAKPSSTNASPASGG